jgi:hypothetical protein
VEVYSQVALPRPTSTRASHPREDKELAPGSKTSSTISSGAGVLSTGDLHHRRSHTDGSKSHLTSSYGVSQPQSQHNGTDEVFSFTRSELIDPLGLDEAPAGELVAPAPGRDAVPRRHTEIFSKNALGITSLEQREPQASHNTTEPRKSTGTVKRQTAEDFHTEVVSERNQSPRRVSHLGISQGQPTTREELVSNVSARAIQLSLTEGAAVVLALDTHSNTHTSTDIARERNVSPRTVLSARNSSRIYETSATNTSPRETLSVTVTEGVIDNALISQ